MRILKVVLCVRFRGVDLSVVGTDHLPANRGFDTHLGVSSQPLR